MSGNQGKAVWSAENTQRELEAARHDRRVAAVRGTALAVILVLAVAALIAGLAGCQPDPCAGHGGLYMWSGNWDYCNDGSVQPAG